MDTVQAAVGIRNQKVSLNFMWCKKLSLYFMLNSMQEQA
jgi:hypothetical protein